MKKNNTLIMIVAALAVIAVALIIYFYLPTPKGNKQPAGYNYADAFGQMKTDALKQLPALEKAVAAHSSSSDAWRNLGRAEYLSGDVNTSIQSFNKAIGINGSNPQFYVDLGNAYEAAGDTAKAEGYYKKAIELNNKEIEVGTPVQSAMTQDELLKAGLGESVVGGEYHLVTPYTALGYLYLKQNRPDEAIKVLELGIAMNPKYPDFYLILANAYMRTGSALKAAESKKMFDKLSLPAR